MGRHISLILATPETFADIIIAGQQSQNVTKLLEVIDSDIKNDPEFKEYIEEASEKLDFHEKEDFNLTTGFYATWILASYKPAWYMRNCSVSIFLERNKADEAQWRRYTTAWPTDLLPGTKITNHFADANYSLGSLISPENAQNFITDYKHDASFKKSVDGHFGVFVWGFFDALSAAVTSQTSLIESSDIFSIIVPPKDGRIHPSEQQCYTTDTYELTNLAIQAFSVLIQIDSAQLYKYTQSGDTEKVEAFKEARQDTINMLVRNATTYAQKMMEKTGVDLPLPSESMWG
jgi:hypothetical protein